MKHAMRSMRGFSLVEIMVVVVIIGLLATVVGVNVNGYMQQAKVTKAQSDLKQFESALNLYYQQNDSYPDTLKDLFRPQKNSKQPYVNGRPEDVLKDPWGSYYHYEVQSDIYQLASYGRDKRSGGTELDADLVVTNAAAER